MQARRRASPAVMGSPVPSCAVPSPACQGVQGKGDDHGGGLAAVVGQLVGVEAFEEGAEREAALPVGGQADAGGGVGGGVGGIAGVVLPR